MAKPNKPSKTAAQNPSPTVAAPPLPAFFQNISIQSAVIFGFAFLLYANTLFHEFVVDDAIVITDNMFTTKGVQGIGGILTEDTFFGFFKERGKEALVSGGRYRPMTLILFACLWQVTHSPFAFHLFTIVLFGLTCVMLFRTVRLMLDNQGVTRSSVISFFTAMIFAAHPIHTEAVANIKGCDEILTLLLSLAALFFALKSVRLSRSVLMIYGAAIFFLALLSKENAITFLAVVPLALYFFTDLSFGKSMARSLPFFAAATIFMVVRTSILGFHFGAAPIELMNNPFVKLENGHWVYFDAGEKLATILFTLGKYVQLLVAPITLTHDYYPRHIDIQSFTNAGVLASIVLYAALIYVAVKGLKGKSIVAFSIFFFLITLSIVSNIVFPVGTNMGERFAFMPSVGFCLAAAAGLFWLAKTDKTSLKLNTPIIALTVILILFSIKTITRNPVWESNYRLFTTDIKTSANSAKLCNAVGGTLTDTAFKEKDETKRMAMLNEAKVHLDNAIKIHPTYKNAYLLLGNCHNYMGKYEAAIPYYKEALRIDPDYKEAKGNLAITLRDAGKAAGEKEHNTAKALQFLNESYALNPTDIETTRLLGVANGMLGNHPKAIEFFQKVCDANPKDAHALFDLGTAWMLGGDPAKGQALRQKAAEMDPTLVQKPQ